MKRIFTIAVCLCAIALVSCAKEEAFSGEKMEKRSLRAWIKKNRPELLGNYQTEGEYYIDVLAWGETSPAIDENDFGGEPIMEQDTCWIVYNYTGYDLEGNVCATRKEMVARMQGTYTDYTHYVPYMNYCGVNNYYGLLEGTYISTRNKITLSEEYVQREDKRDICRGTEFVMRKGSKVRLYLPSTIAYLSSGSLEEGGYEGQYALDMNVPAIMEVEVLRVIKNPSDNELAMIEALVEDSKSKAGSNIWEKVKIKDKTTIEGVTDNNSNQEQEPEGDGMYKGLYYTQQFDPANANTHLGYMLPQSTAVNDPYKDSDRYVDMAKFDEELFKILDEKFGDMITKTSDEDAKVIGESNAAKIWYVGRFLDGFIFDTNIAEVKKLVFDTASGASAITYEAEQDEKDYISAWFHCIPKLRYGRWGAILTSSGYAYGAEGVSGSSSTTSSGASSYYNNYYAYNNYYNYANSYYYNDYYSYPIDYYSYNSAYDSGETTTTIETEIMPYSPMVFYVFVEPMEGIK